MGMIELLDDNHIYHKEHGKNITSGWVNINCPHCGESGNHCGYNPQGSYFSCWKCGHHTVESTVMKLLKVSYETLKLVFRQYNIALTMKSDVRSFKHNQEAVIDEAKLEKYIKLGKPMEVPYKNYLTRRGFSWRQAEEMFGLRCTGRVGKYPSRIVMPVIRDGVEVSWVSRSILENPSVRYVNCPKESEVVSMKDVLFNADNSSSTVIVTEGPLDAIAVGYGGVSTLSCEYTPQQVTLLKNYNRVFIWFDEDKAGKRAAEKLASDLGYNTSIEILDSPLDPADTLKADPNEIKKLKRSILL